MTKPTRPELTPEELRTPEPKVMVSLSYDGGKTFAPWVERSLGKVGEYKRRVVWNRLGSTRNDGVVIRFAVSDRCPLAVTDQHVEVEGGTL